MRNEKICNLALSYGRIAKIAAQLSCGLVNSAMGQIPCSTERISSYKYIAYFTKLQTAVANQQQCICRRTEKRLIFTGIIRSYDTGRSKAITFVSIRRREQTAIHFIGIAYAVTRYSSCLLSAVYNYNSRNAVTGSQRPVGLWNLVTRLARRNKRGI